MKVDKKSAIKPASSLATESAVDSTMNVNVQPPHWLGHPFLYSKEIDSTNRQLHDLSDAAFTHGILALADYQTRGKGQGVKHWASESGQNLLFSIGLKPMESTRLILLTLAVAESIAEYISTLTALPVRIKWPNDILVGGAKLGGILTETLFLGSNLERVIIGIGLNVNQQEFPKFQDPHALQAVSLCSLTGVEWHRISLLEQLCHHMEHAYASWESRAPELCSKIHSRLIGYGQWVQVDINGQHVGLRKCLGLTQQGELLLLDETYNVHRHNHENIRLMPQDLTLATV